MTESQITNKIYVEYLNFLKTGNKAQCLSIVSELIEKQDDIKDIYVNLFQRSLYQIGELWATNKISVAVEHVAMAITESLITMLYPTLFKREHFGKTAVITCVTSEYHQLGAQMVADIFEFNGWDGYFLGANTPLDYLIDYIGTKKPDIVGISVTLHRHIAQTRQTVSRIRQSFPQMQIIIGGQAIKSKNSIDDIIDRNTAVVLSLFELENQLKNHSSNVLQSN